MSIQLEKPWTDTPVTGGTPVSLTLDTINFGTDWAVTSDNGKEAYITNLTCPLDAAEKFKFARMDVSNIYTNSGIDANMMTPSRRGTSILCQLNSIYNVVDSENPALKWQLPMSCHVVIKVPNSELITADVIKGYLCRTLAGLFETDSSSSDRIAGMVRGALTPQICCSK